MKGPRVSLSHAGFHVYDMDKMIDFYVRVFGFKVTDRARTAWYSWAPTPRIITS